MDNEKFGQFVRSMRKERQMTQQQLAERLHLTDKAVSKWERGLSLPDISMLEQLARELDVSVVELLCGERKEENIRKDAVEELLVAVSSPEQRPRARTAAFLLIDSMMGIVRDYDIFRRHMDGGQNSAQDAALLAELLCRGIEPGFAAPSSGKACFNPQSPHPPTD